MNPEATTETSITNPCDHEGCPNIATHRVRLHESAWGSHVDAEYCDEHVAIALGHGAKHLEWLDKPSVAAER